jgi:hypothetical protein
VQLTLAHDVARRIVFGGDHHRAIGAARDTHAEPRRGAPDHLRVMAGGGPVVVIKHGVLVVVDLAVPGLGRVFRRPRRAAAAEQVFAVAVVRLVHQAAAAVASKLIGPLLGNRRQFG